MDITTTASKTGKFKARFFHFFEEEFGRVKGHFGPIHNVAVHLDGKNYSLCGEEDSVCIHSFRLYLMHSKEVAQQKVLDSEK